MEDRYNECFDGNGGALRKMETKEEEEGNRNRGG